MGALEQRKELFVLDDAKKPNSMLAYVRTDDVLGDLQNIIDTARQKAYQAVNVALLQRNWLIGKRIAEELLQGDDRAEYGARVMKSLSKDLTRLYGKGFDYSSLYKFSRFYKWFPEILDSVSPKSQALLTWTHYRVLL